MIDLRDTDERMAAAGEYVLGTLNSTDRVQFEAAMEQDRALLALVYDWQDRLLALSREAAPVAPGSQLWARIETALGTRGEPKGQSVPRWWQRLSYWQVLSGAAVAASIALTVLLVQQRPSGSADVRYVAVLQSPVGSTAGWVVELQQEKLRLRPVGDAAVVPGGRSLQFWTKPPGAAAPTSLGLIQAGETVELPLSQLPGTGQQVLFEITLEPEGGSTIDRPTGPILYVGRTIAM